MEDQKSGKHADRPELVAALDFMQAGDTLVVPSLDRLSRSRQDLITTVGDLRRRGVGFTSLHENLDTTTPGGWRLSRRHRRTRAPAFKNRSFLDDGRLGPLATSNAHIQEQTGCRARRVPGLRTGVFDGSLDRAMAESLAGDVRRGGE